MTRKLTMEEHLLLAQHLRNIDNEITGIRDVIFGLGVVTRVGHRLFTVGQKLSELKCALDSLMLRDHPNGGRTQLEVYFGARGPGERE